MRWHPGHDREERDLAAALARHHAPYWVVMWSYSLRVWVAFYLGPAAVAPLRYADPDRLSRQMRHVVRTVAAGRSP
ncbi:hypothetical protein [Nocardiopsis tropica]|uniref:Uncharacterized protein n=1 Tax=Nocardiopsis tropica TaxID=109330 RepID=A0ABU7KY30_9ACTN|nr:hypothetical protein [Nocardiopsis umidischolae]MEE2054216.1 hypothetical protein [Nocardiopsis umidischolae]